MVYDTVINGVATKVVNRKSDGKSITIYEVTDSAGTVWTTARKDLGNEANRMIGRGVQIQGETVQNGNFTNHYLEDIRQMGEAPTQYAAPPQQWGPPAGVQAPMAPQTPSPPPPPSPGPPPVAAPTSYAAPPPQGPTDKDWFIFRQTATKVAVHISSNPAEFWGNVDDLIRFYAYNQKPTITTPPPTPAQQERFIPEAAVADPGPDPTRPEWQDEDIPF